MGSYEIDDLIITPEKQGVERFGTFSYPVRYGRFSEIRTSTYTFQFNLEGQIKLVEGKGNTWPYPAEWLKRTAGNDWVYYSSGDYKGIYDLLGEYYYPYLSYPSNAILGDNPFESTRLTSVISAWTALRRKAGELISRALPEAAKALLLSVARNSPGMLRSKAAQLHHLIRGRVTVLPPDSRHVDYEIIPITIAEGCLLNCGFCRVKSGRGFKALPPAEILDQIQHLKQLYGKDLRNYSAVFLGQHDALQAGRDLVRFAAEKAYDLFELERSYVKEPVLFLFGSPLSIIGAEDELFETLNSLPYSTTFINIGLEAADCATLRGLRRPVAVETVREAFSRMLDINRRYQKVEVTANFVFSDQFSADHFNSLLELTRNRLDPIRAKGAMYLSPVVDEQSVDDARRREIMRRFHDLKTHSRLPTFLYLIQRL
ncbi:MAG TPA: radical SAM protein [Syntrophorhabdales bacterium]|nr:radical SAM protein [Syntrophorhabdales bacterium]